MDYILKEVGILQLLFILLPSILWYTEIDKMIGAPDEKDPLSIFRLSVRTGWRWQPSCGLATLPCSRL